MAKQGTRHKTKGARRGRITNHDSRLTLHRLAQRVGAALKSRDLMLATAESCTGGWISETVTTVAGSSGWFERGFVASTYGSDVHATAYFYDDGTSLQLPNRDAGTYFEILPDKSFLYVLNSDNDAIGAAGIYRYDPTQGSYTLLVEGARVAYTLPLK